MKAGAPMDLKEIKRRIKELTALLQGTGVSELEVEQGGVRIKVKKDPGVSAEAAPASRSSDRSESASRTGRKAKAQDDTLVMVCSPIVGTFYRAPGPGADHYVEVGDVVKKGQVLCVVEAMKLMNEIESDVDGKVVEILVENTRPVEYGEPLIRIEPV